jgi:hypothetical protein
LPPCPYGPLLQLQVVLLVWQPLVGLPVQQRAALQLLVSICLLRPAAAPLTQDLPGSRPTATAGCLASSMRLPQQQTGALQAALLCCSSCSTPSRPGTGLEAAPVAGGGCCLCCCFPPRLALCCCLGAPLIQVVAQLVVLQRQPLAARGCGRWCMGRM